jgi:hypothetical protein
MQTSTLILTGDGYQLGITPDAEALKQSLIDKATGILVISNLNDVGTARALLKELAGFRLTLEKSRKAVKEPVLEIGRNIDAKAVEFGGAVVSEEQRIEKLVSDFAAEQERQRRQAEADARAALQEAERLKREAEQAELHRQRAELAAEQQRLQAERDKLEAEKRAASATGFLAKKRAEDAAKKAAEDQARIQAEQDAANVAAAKQAEERDHQIAEAGNVAVDASLASLAPTISGVKPDLDYEIKDIGDLYRAAPHLVQLVPLRREIIAALKQMQAANLPVALPGVDVREIFKVSKR